MILFRKMTILFSLHTFRLFKLHLKVILTPSDFGGTPVFFNFGFLRDFPLRCGFISFTILLNIQTRSSLPM